MKLKMNKPIEIRLIDNATQVGPEKLAHIPELIVRAYLLYFPRPHRYPKTGLLQWVVDHNVIALYIYNGRSYYHEFSRGVEKKLSVKVEKRLLTKIFQNDIIYQIMDDLAKDLLYDQIFPEKKSRDAMNRYWKVKDGKTI